jgi:hypothetical protein
VGFAVMDALGSWGTRSVGFAVMEGLAPLAGSDPCVGFAVMDALGSWGTRCVAVGVSPPPVFKGEDEADGTFCEGLTEREGEEDACEGRTEGDADGVGYGEGAVIFTHWPSGKLKYIGSKHGRISVTVPGGAQPKGSAGSAGLRTTTGKRPEH